MAEDMVKINMEDEVEEATVIEKKPNIFVRGVNFAKRHAIAVAAGAGVIAGGIVTGILMGKASSDYYEDEGIIDADYENSFDDNEDDSMSDEDKSEE